MNRASLFITVVACSLASHAAAAADEERANIIILDKTAVQNLGVQTEVAEQRDFESSLFAIGRLEEIPARRSVLSSRIPGRVMEVSAFLGDRVNEGQVLVRVESRQPGRPPPTIELRAMQSGLVVESHVQLGQPVAPENELLPLRAFAYPPLATVKSLPC